MLTEEQRAKAILSEPAKPFIPSQEQDSGPFKLGKHINQPGFKEGLFYLTRPLRTNTSLPSNETLSRLTNLEGVDTVDRAINYLLTKGSTHNNPILSDFRAGRDDPQGSYLAFFQANVVGSKLYASSVFMNRNTSSYDDDIELSNYLATKFAKALGVGFGDLSFFTIRTTNG